MYRDRDIETYRDNAKNGYMYIYIYYIYIIYIYTPDRAGTAQK